MTPYYADESVTLYHGDCREITAWLDADVLVTDPPYGIDRALSASYKGKRPAAGFTPVHDRAVTWDANLEARDAALALWGGGAPGRRVRFTEAARRPTIHASTGPAHLGQGGVGRHG